MIAYLSRQLGNKRTEAILNIIQVQLLLDRFFDALDKASLLSVLDLALYILLDIYITLNLKALAFAHLHLQVTEKIEYRLNVHAASLFAFNGTISGSTIHVRELLWGRGGCSKDVR